MSSYGTSGTRAPGQSRPTAGDHLWDKNPCKGFVPVPLVVMSKAQWDKRQKVSHRSQRKDRHAAAWLPAPRPAADKARAGRRLKTSDSSTEENGSNML
jgi:hypothetical protein